MKLHPEYKSGCANNAGLAAAWFLILSGITIAAALFSSNMAVALVGIIMVIAGIIILNANRV